MTDQPIKCWNYKIPLGACEATIMIHGPAITPEDMEDLGQFAAMFKKQLERAIAVHAIIEPHA